MLGLTSMPAKLGARRSVCRPRISRHFAEHLLSFVVIPGRRLVRSRILPDFGPFGNRNFSFRSTVQRKSRRLNEKSRPMHSNTR